MAEGESKMTLRPFRISNGNLHIVRIQTHRDEDLIQKSIKIPKNFFKKLLSHPITAFGYDINYKPNNKELPNPKFDKFQVIRALDFWIEYFVYQNKCDYILEGTVNKDFELHLEELIRVREAVLKESADTKYVRQKIRVQNTSIGIDPGGKDFAMTSMTRLNTNKDNMIEFTENVLDASNTPFSTVDQFCYKVKTMTRKEYEEYNKPKLYNKDVAQNVIPGSRLSRMISDIIRTQSNFNFEENFIDDGPRFEWMATGTGGITAADENTNPDHIIGTAAEPLTAEDVVIRDENDRFRRARSGNPNDIAFTVSDVRFSTEPSLTATDGFFTLPVNATAQSITITDDENDIITYENMMVGVGSPMFNPGSNDFVMTPVRFAGNGTEISMDVFNENNLEQLARSMGTHTVQFAPNQRNFLEIDGQEYHTTNVSISHDARRPSIRFDNLWIESVEASVDGRGSTFRVDFIQQSSGITRTNLSIILVDPNQGSLMRQSIDSDQARAWSLQMLGNNRVNIGGDVYTVLEPLRIDMN